MIGNTISDRITKVSKTLPQNNSVTNDEENTGIDREIHRKRYTSPEQRQKNFYDLRLIQ